MGSWWSIRGDEYDCEWALDRAFVKSNTRHTANHLTFFRRTFARPTFDERLYLQRIRTHQRRMTKALRPLQTHNLYLSGGCNTWKFMCCHILKLRHFFLFYMFIANIPSIHNRPGEWHFSPTFPRPIKCKWSPTLECSREINPFCQFRFGCIQLISNSSSQTPSRPQLTHTQQSRYQRIPLRNSCIFF